MTVQQSRLVDFSELSQFSRGEGLETLFYGILSSLGPHIRAERSGRGADGGRDISFTETLPSDFQVATRRWLVQCKDFSESGRSVTEGDVPSIVEKCLQHQCDAFLLVTTTVPSTGLVEHLRGLSINQRNPIVADFIDYQRLSDLLLRPSSHRTFRTHLPNSYRRYREQEDYFVLLQKLESAGVPQRDLQDLQLQIDRLLHRVDLSVALRGKLKQGTVDEAADTLSAAFRARDIDSAAGALNELLFEEWLLIVDTLIDADKDWMSKVLVRSMELSDNGALSHQCLSTLIDKIGLPVSKATKYFKYLDRDEEDIQLLVQSYDIEELAKDVIDHDITSYAEVIFSEFPQGTAIDEPQFVEVGFGVDNGVLCATVTYTVPAWLNFVDTCYSEEDLNTLPTKVRQSKDPYPITIHGKAILHFNGGEKPEVATLGLEWPVELANWDPEEP